MLQTKLGDLSITEKENESCPNNTVIKHHLLIETVLEQAVLYTKAKRTYIREPKTPMAIRYITIPQQMLNELREYREFLKRTQT